MSLMQVSFFSEALGFTSQMNVILPQKAMGGPMRDCGYPVLWLLHGATEDHTAWQRHTSIERYAQNHGLAVVMPAAQLSFYSNMAYGGRFFDFFTEELPQIVRDFFPISGRREDNYIAGSSMGGYGALKLGLSKPEMYSAIGCFSLGAFMHDDNNAMVNSPMVLRLLKMAFGVDNADELKATEHDPITLADKAIKEGKPLPRIFHVCGTEEDAAILNVARLTSMLLSEKPIDYTYQEGPGGHTWEFWDEWIQKYLDWLEK